MFGCFVSLRDEIVSAGSCFVLCFVVVPLKEFVDNSLFLFYCISSFVFLFTV